MAKKEKEREESQDHTKVKFDYIKSQYFRVIHVDGAVGSVTPAGTLHFALYNERPAIPRQITHLLKADGSLGERLDEETVSRDAFVREMEVDVILTVDVAESLRNWLEDKIKEARGLQAKAAEIKKGKS